MKNVGMLVTAAVFFFLLAACQGGEAGVEEAEGVETEEPTFETLDEYLEAIVEQAEDMYGWYLWSDEETRLLIIEEEHVVPDVKNEFQAEYDKAASWNVANFSEVENFETMHGYYLNYLEEMVTYHELMLEYEETREEDTLHASTDSLIDSEDDLEAFINASRLTREDFPHLNF